VRTRERGGAPVGSGRVQVPAGPQDSSVGDAGHRAQRVIEPSPVQSRIRQDRTRGGGRRGTRHC